MGFYVGALSRICILMFMIMILIMSMIVTGCRSRHVVKAEGSTTAKVEGEAVVRHVISIEFGVCDTLPDAAKIECVQSLLKILVEASRVNSERQAGIPSVGEIGGGL